MTREDLLAVYLSKLERAKFELDSTEKGPILSPDPIEKVRLDLEAEVRRSMVRVYDGLVKFLQEPQ